MGDLSNRKQTLSDSSLEWETFEQNCLWQLIGAHNISVDSILPVLAKLEYQSTFLAFVASI